MPASGKSVNVPYCVVYDLRDDKISELRIYMPMELFSQQLAEHDLHQSSCWPAATSAV